MFELVIWSFVLALTPVVLGLAWKLISGMADGVGVWLSWVFDDSEARSVRRPLGSNPPSGLLAVAGRTPGSGTGRSLARNRREPSRN